MKRSSNFRTKNGMKSTKTAREKAQVSGMAAVVRKVRKATKKK